MRKKWYYFNIEFVKSFNKNNRFCLRFFFICLRSCFEINLFLWFLFDLLKLSFLRFLLFSLKGVLNSLNILIKRSFKIIITNSLQIRVVYEKEKKKNYLNKEKINVNYNV